MTLALNSNEEEVDKDDKESLAWVRALQFPLRQFKAYDDYVHERTPYATHQGVKGLEFPRVLVLIDEEVATCSAMRNFSMLLLCLKQI